MRFAKFATLASALVLMFALAGCGSDDDPSTPASGAPGTGGGETALTVTLDANGSGEAESVTLSCDSAADDYSADACAAAATIANDAAAPTAPDTACTELYGGPDIATVKGTLNGQAIDAELTRTNGCEIDRFEPFAPMLQALFPDYSPGQSLQAPA